MWYDTSQGPQSALTGSQLLVWPGKCIPHSGVFARRIVPGMLGAKWDTEGEVDCFFFE